MVLTRSQSGTMTKDKGAESTAKEVEKNPSDVATMDTSENAKDPGAMETVDDDTKDKTAVTTTKKDSGYSFGKYNWDDNQKSTEMAVLIPPSGAIVDYAWCDDGDEKKSVSLYITLEGLDKVQEDEIKLALINDNRGLSFKVKHVDGKFRFLKIEKLYKKVKSVRMIRKKGRNRVVLKLKKEDDDKSKWWSLKEGGSVYNDNDYGDDEWSDAGDDFDLNNEGEAPLDGDDKVDEDGDKPVADKKEEDVPMEDTQESKEECD